MMIVSRKQLHLSCIALFVILGISIIGSITVVLQVQAFTSRSTTSPLFRQNSRQRQGRRQGHRRQEGKSPDRIFKCQPRRNNNNNAEATAYSFILCCSAVSEHDGEREREDGSVVRVKVSDLLSDLPTPTLLVELSLAESALNNNNNNNSNSNNKTQISASSLDDFLLRNLETNNKSNDNDDEILRDNYDILDGSIFIHTKVTDTSVRDQINRDLGSGKSSVIGKVDAASELHVPGGAFLGIGLSNHHVGGYYWARGMGIGASLEAHGVAFRQNSSTCITHDDDAAVSDDDDDESSSSLYGGGELYWKKRDPNSSVSRGATTVESSNSNDGKRSEWADFLVSGDTVQLIPYSAARVLRESAFQRLVGVRRVGRPLGADPIVERIWKRGSSDGSWIPLQ